MTNCRVALAIGMQRDRDLVSPTTIHKDLIPILFSDNFLTPAQVNGTAGSK